MEAQTLYFSESNIACWCMPRDVKQHITALQTTDTHKQVLTGYDDQK